MHNSDIVIYVYSDIINNVKRTRQNKKRGKKDMKEIWNGYDKKGNIIETFFGNYAEAVDYFNSEESNPRVERFNKEV